MSRVRQSYDLVLEPADYARRCGPPERTIVICSQQRSGSTLLSEAMYFAGAFGCPLEYFHPTFRQSFERRFRSADFLSYLSALHAHRTGGNGVFSTKLFWIDVLDLAHELAPKEFGKLGWSATHISTADHRRILSLIVEAIPNPEFVFLTRRDEVRQAISLFVASGTGSWRKFTNGVAGGASPEYSFDQIVATLAFVQNCNRQWLNFFRANNLRYQQLVYEDLAQDYERTLRKLFIALGRPDAPIVPPRLRRQADATSDEFRERFMSDFARRARGKG